MKSMYQIERPDIRLRRAQSLTALLMEEIRDMMPTDFDQQAVCDRLIHVLYENGAAWTTDEDRAAHGLEPRDDLGWTPSERIAQKQRELEAMQMQQVFILQNSNNT